MCTIAVPSPEFSIQEVFWYFIAPSASSCPGQELVRIARLTVVASCHNDEKQSSCTGHLQGVCNRMRQPSALPSSELQRPHCCLAPFMPLRGDQPQRLLLHHSLPTMAAWHRPLLKTSKRMLKIGQHNIRRAQTKVKLYFSASPSARLCKSKDATRQQCGTCTLVSLLLSVVTLTGVADNDAADPDKS